MVTEYGLKRKIAAYPKLIVPLQIDLAIGTGRYVVQSFGLAQATVDTLETARESVLSAAPA